MNVFNLTISNKKLINETEKKLIRINYSNNWALILIIFIFEYLSSYEKY